MTGNDPSREDGARSVQDYIDERPVWADGTAVAWTPMTRCNGASGAALEAIEKLVYPGMN